MKTFTYQAAQGDLLITKVEELPSDLVAAKKEGDHIVAHSETGHNHVISSGDCDMYAAANDDFVLYLVVHKEAELRHLRDFDRHETIKVPPGKYRINRQREYIPDGFRRAAD